MKEATRHPHFVDIDQKLKNFSGNILDGSYPLRPASYFTEDLIGYKLIGSQSFKDQVTKLTYMLLSNTIELTSLVDFEFRVLLCLLGQIQIFNFSSATLTKGTIVVPNCQLKR